MFKLTKQNLWYAPIAILHAIKPGATPRRHRTSWPAPARQRKDNLQCLESWYYSPLLHVHSEKVGVLNHETIRQWLALQQAHVSLLDNTDEDDALEDTGRQNVHVLIHVQASSRRQQRLLSKACVHDVDKTNGMVIHQTSTHNDSALGEADSSNYCDGLSRVPSDEVSSSRQLVGQINAHSIQRIIHGPFDPGFASELATYKQQQMASTQWEPEIESETERRWLLVERMHAFSIAMTVTSYYATVCVTVVVFLLSVAIPLYVVFTWPAK